MFYCLFELAKNQKIQQKVQDELDQVNKNLGESGLTYDSMAEMKYLECCIDETLRKYPIVPTLIRECTKDYSVSGDDNLMIPKGTPIFIPVLGLQRDPRIFENPMEFKPERFLNSTNGNGNSKGLFYLPFGDGPRNCIGMRMAKLTTKMGLAVILSKFKFELCDKEMLVKELEFHPNMFILTPNKEHRFKVTTR